jgi:DNA-binding MarR family transcriptional regulator
MNMRKAASLIPLVIADIYQLAGELRDRGDGIARAAGQTQARWQVISAASAAPKTIPQIARRLGVTRQNVQRIADRLVQERFATFEDNPDHRGSPHLILTPSGRAALEQLSRAAEAHGAALAMKVDARAIEKLHRGLRSLIRALDEIDQQGGKPWTMKSSTTRRS